MAQFIDSEFHGGIHRLDGHTWIGCKFVKAKIEIGKGNYVLKRCQFSGCGFEFDGEAANIAELVTMLSKQQDALPLFDEKHVGQSVIPEAQQA